MGYRRFERMCQEAYHAAAERGLTTGEAWEDVRAIQP